MLQKYIIYMFLFECVVGTCTTWFKNKREVVNGFGFHGVLLHAFLGKL